MTVPTAQGFIELSIDSVSFLVLCTLIIEYCGVVVIITLLYIPKVGRKRGIL